jgi:hypothetical protein
VRSTKNVACSCRAARSLQSGFALRPVIVVRESSLVYLITTSTKDAISLSFTSLAADPVAAAYFIHCLDKLCESFPCSPSTSQAAGSTALNSIIPSNLFSVNIGTV